MPFTSSAVEDRTPGRTVMEVHLGTVIPIRIGLFFVCYDGLFREHNNNI
jgi:hypothetical protein